MPYCRECGKEVEENWITCPYCSHAIGPPSSGIMRVQDSVVMGDVAINDVTKCVNCESTGVTLITCSYCKEMYCCEICRVELQSPRERTISDTRLLPSKIFGAGFVMGDKSHNERISALGNKRLCNLCFVKERDELCDSTCDICGIHYNESDLDFTTPKQLSGRVRKDDRRPNEYGLCYSCTLTQRVLNDKEKSIAKLEKKTLLKDRPRLFASRNYRKMKSEMEELRQRLLDRRNGGI